MLIESKKAMSVCVCVYYDSIISDLNAPSQCSNTYFKKNHLESKKIDDFDEYMFGLRPATNTRNPWFREYWHKLTGCSGGRESRFCDEVMESSLVICFYLRALL